MSTSIRCWHKQFSFARRDLRDNERIWARDCPLISRPGAAAPDTNLEYGKDYTARSTSEMHRMLSLRSSNKQHHLYETLTDSMRHTCFYYCIDVPAPSQTSWNALASRLIVSISIRYFARHLRSAFSSLTRLDVDESNIVCMNASTSSGISWFVIFRKVIFYDHHVSMREYIEEAMVGLYTQLRQLRRQLSEEKAPDILQNVMEAAVSQGIINSTMYEPIQALPLLGASRMDNQQILRLVPTQFATDPERPAPESIKFCDNPEEGFSYSLEQWQSCLVHQPDSFVVNRYAIRLWPLPDSICTLVARKTYPEGYQDLPDEDRHVTWAPKFLRQSRTVWDRMKQDVIDEFRQRLLANQSQIPLDLQADSIDGDRVVIRDDGTRWRAQDLEEGNAVFCPLHQTREGDARAALFTFWLSTLSVDRIRAEAVIYPSRFRPGFSNGRVIFCTGACKRMISIIEIPEQVPFHNEPGAGQVIASPFDTRLGNVIDIVSGAASLPHGASHLDLSRSPFDKARLVVIESDSESGTTRLVASHLNAAKAAFVVLTTTMATSRTMASAYAAHCYADPGIWVKQNNREWTANFSPQCTVAFDHIGTMMQALPARSKWDYVILEDVFAIYLEQQFGLADEAERNLEALVGVCSLASVVYALGAMIPSSVIDFAGRVLCRFDPDLNPDFLQKRHISVPIRLVPTYCYHRIVDLFDYQILSFLDHFCPVSGMSSQPAVTFCTSLEFAKLLQWILQQICHQYGYDSRRIRTYFGRDEQPDSLSSERFSIAQALEHADELLVTSLTLSGYNILQFFRRHFTYFHDGVFTQSALINIENRIQEFGKSDNGMCKHVWYRAGNTGFGPLNAKRISHVLSFVSAKQSPPVFAESKLPTIVELSDDIKASRGNLPNDWLPSDFKYSTEALPMHRLRWLFSTISGYFDLQNKRAVPEWMCDSDLKSVNNDFEFDVTLEGLLRAAVHDGTSTPVFSTFGIDRASNARLEKQNTKRTGTRRSV